MRYISLLLRCYARWICWNDLKSSSQWSVLCTDSFEFSWGFNLQVPSALLPITSKAIRSLVSGLKNSTLTAIAMYALLASVESANLAPIITLWTWCWSKNARVSPVPSLNYTLHLFGCMNRTYGHIIAPWHRTQWNWRNCERLDSTIVIFLTRHGLASDYTKHGAFCNDEEQRKEVQAAARSDYDNDSNNDNDLNLTTSLWKYYSKFIPCIHFRWRARICHLSALHIILLYCAK